jgi:hypothetical protein
MFKLANPYFFLFITYSLTRTKMKKLKGVSRKDAKDAKKIFKSWFKHECSGLSLRAWRLCEKISCRFE